MSNNYVSKNILFKDYLLIYYKNFLNKYYFNFQIEKFVENTLKKVWKKIQKILKKLGKNQTYLKKN